MRQKVLIGIVIVLLLASGTVFGYRSYSQGQFLAEGDSAFSKGNYLAALSNYFVLNEDKDDLEVEIKIQQAKESLVAEENLQRAKEAAEGGDWLEVKYLLSNIQPVVDSTLYEQVFLLYEEAADKVRALEAKIAGEMQLLRDEATQVKQEREDAEQEAIEIAGKLSEVEKAKELAEQEASIAQQEATAAQQETVAAQQEAALERLLKFKNELSLLIDLLESGGSLVEDGILQIESENESVALTFLNQARALFSNIEEHGMDLKMNRTPELALFQVDMLLSTTSLLKKAVLSLGSATIFIEEKDDAFYQYLNDGKAFYDSGLDDIGELKGFVD